MHEGPTHCGSVINAKPNHLRSMQNLPLITISTFDAGMVYIEPVNATKTYHVDLQTVKIHRLISVVLVNVSSRCGSAEVLALCDTGSVHSWVSNRLVGTLSLTGHYAKLALNGSLFNRKVIPERVEVVVLSVHANPTFLFDIEPFTKSLTLRNEVINILELQKQLPHLASFPPIVHTYSDIQLNKGLDAYYVIHPPNAFRLTP